MIIGFVFGVIMAVLAAINMLNMSSGKLFYIWCGIPVHFIFATFAVFFLLLGILSFVYGKQSRTTSGESVSEKRRLHCFEIFVFPAVLVFIGLFVYALMDDTWAVQTFTDVFPVYLLACAAVPGLLSLLPVSPASKGRKAPGLAILSFILVILFVLVNILICVGVKMNPMGTDANGCVIAAAVFTFILFIQSIRRLKRS